MQIYAWNILAEWSLVAGCIFVMRANGLGLANIGQGLGKSYVTVTLLLIVIATFVVIRLSRKKARSSTKEAALKQAAEQVKRIVPTSAAERGMFVLVALTAGICEEFLYRGWLLNFAGVGMGSLWLGLLVSSVIFGLAHAYQGRRGVIGAGGLGLVLGLLFLLCRSLIPIQVVHAAIDLNNGLALGKLAQEKS